MLALVFFMMAAMPLERDPAFQAARASYEAFEFDDARRGFETLAGGATVNDADRARLLVWVGMCHAEEGALPQATRTFEQAAALDPDVAPLASMSPKARRMLDDARRLALPRPRPAPQPVVSPSPPVSDTDAQVQPPRSGEPREGFQPALLVGTAAIGVGVVTAALSAAVGLAADGAAQGARSEPNAAEAASRFAGAQQLSVTANVGFALAAIAGAAGLVGVLMAAQGD